MDEKAVRGAKDVLAIMEAASVRLATAEVLRDVRLAWYEVISAAGRIFTKLEQGAKADGKSAAWFGRIRHVRSNDPLLSYALHARNSHEHGIDEITANRGPSITIYHPEAGPIISFGAAHNANDTISTSTTPLPLVEIVDGKEVPSEEQHVVWHGGFIQLSAVRDRGVEYSVPEIHLGTAIAEVSPSGLSALLLTYCRSLIKDAEAMIK